jgi:hypothetical protein
VGSSFTSSLCAFGVRTMKRWWFSICLLCILAVGSPATGAELSNQPQEGKAGSKPVTDLASLIANLRATGVGAEPGEEVEQPFFSVTGRMIKVRGEDVQVFQYADAAAVEAQAALVSGNGSAVGTTKPHWIGPPHFYKKGRLLVLYVGDNDQVLRTLETS